GFMIPYSLPYARWKRSNPALKYRVCERQNFINDRTHAISALARVSQYGTPAEKKQVRAAVYKKYPSLKKGRARK
ncbi:hypothetical protein, partial [Bifidobacterium magnum]|uniref:hypothetical protein n=1 Tax=Bifidobacterium magnum TaxID=1692 RepID=UPI001B7F82B8